MKNKKKQKKKKKQQQQQKKKQQQKTNAQTKRNKIRCRLLKFIPNMLNEH